MKTILVYARVGGTKQFIGTFEDIDTLTDEVMDFLDRSNRSNLTNKTFFLLNGEEYKLFLEDEK
ncbi:hypothetical protein [Enterococcus olivae]